MAGMWIDGVMYDENGQQVIINNGDECVLPFPLGYRFRPTNEELVGFYLTRKLKNLELPPLPQIPEVDLYKFSTPRDLLEKYGMVNERESGWYCFTPITKMSVNGNRASRTTPGGYWKATSGDAPVRSSGHTIGHTKTLCFYQGAKPAKKTNWIMHEFRIGNGGWVLCKIFERNIGSGTARQRDAAEVSNDTNEQPQQNKEVFSTVVVPAAVTNNAGELQQPIIMEQNLDVLAQMLCSEIVVPGNGNQPLQTINQDFSCPDFDVNMYLQDYENQLADLLV